MKHFFERIEAKARDVTQAPVLIVAIGTSVTQGMRENGVLNSAKVYHRLLQVMLEDRFPLTTFSTINAGVSGDNLAGGLQRLDRDVIRHDPDLVLVDFGLNDALEGIEGVEAFRSNLQRLIERLQNETRADLMLLTPSFIASRESPRIHPAHAGFADRIIRAGNDGSLERIAEVIREVAGDIPVADVYEEWRRVASTGFDVDQWIVNGLNHPGDEGHRLAATVVFNSIMQHRPADQAGGSNVQKS